VCVGMLVCVRCVFGWGVCRCACDMCESMCVCVFFVGVVCECV
jgi:hypothetical protein